MTFVEGDSDKVTKNCFLVNILKAIDRNLDWVDDYPVINKVVMLEAIIDRCHSRIENIQSLDEEPAYKKRQKKSHFRHSSYYKRVGTPKKVKRESRIATYLSNTEAKKS